MSALASVLERLKNVRREGNAHMASCPRPDHGQRRGDLNPSLSVSVDQEGKVLLRCFAGCDNESIVEALGMQMANLFERRNGSDEGGLTPPPKHRQPINRARSRTTRPTSG